MIVSWSILKDVTYLTQATGKYICLPNYYDEDDEDDDNDDDDDDDDDDDEEEDEEDEDDDDDEEEEEDDDDDDDDDESNCTPTKTYLPYLRARKSLEKPCQAHYENHFSFKGALSLRAVYTYPKM